MKRLICSALLFALLLSVFAVGAGAEVYEGRALDEDAIHKWDAGEAPEGWDEEFELAAYYDIQYHLDTETGVLRIFCGEKNPQKMLQYAKGEWVPWTKDNMRPYIKTVIIEEGVTTVGRFSFDHCENLETVYLPHTCWRVDQTTFYECPKLKTIYYAGNEEDFNRNFTDEYGEPGANFIDLRNSYTGGSKEIKARDLVVFGESVQVFCKNQDGEIFDSYTVGGYAVGDSYTIEAKSYDGVEFVGKESVIEGKYKKNDSTEIVFEYTCEHEYELRDENQPCSYFCIYCGCTDPEREDEHTWNVKKDTERGLFSKRVLDKECTVCGATKYESALPYIWYVAAGGGVLLIVIAVICAIVIPIRKKKKMRDMTW